jgi:excisionase family DNA binding protein
VDTTPCPLLFPSVRYCNWGGRRTLGTTWFSSKNGETPVSNFRAIQATAAGEAEPPRFLTPAEVAHLFRVSKITIYRAIRDGDLPAVPVRGRWAVPARVIDTLERSALALLDASEAEITDQGVVNAGGRPRPGANQTGAGSFSTQHAARYGEHATSARPGRSSGGVA